MSRFPSFLHRVFESPREEIARGPGWCQHLRTAVRQLQAHNPGRKCIETIAFWLQIIKRYAARDLIIPLRERNTALLELPMKKETSMYMYICRLKSQLRQVFPQYLTIFSKVSGKASLEVLSQYPSPEAILSAGADALTALIRKAAGKGEAMARKKAEKLLATAQEALSFEHGNSGIIFLVGHCVEMIRILDTQTAAILQHIKQSLLDRPDPLLTRQTKLLESIPGAGFLTAVTIVCEIGDFSAFRCPKKLYSYFGLAPVVRQSGNSAGADLRISKRGSPYARRCFYMLALQSVSLRKNGEPKTPVLRAYYLEKCKSKPKMTALGAIMHKLCSIVFAVLRDEKPFVLISPQEHCQKYLSASQAT